MRIGIIGAGAAGLTACWLLSENHDVTLFEKQDRLGGHAQTVEVEQDGQIIPIEAGFEFVMDSMFPTFIKLLGLLEVDLHRYPISATLYSRDQRTLTMMPPFNSGGIVWSALKPYQICNLIQLQLALTFARRLMDDRDTSITIEKYIERLPVLQSFKTHFLYPFLQAQWCVELDEFKQFAAYNALKYSAMNINGLQTPTGVEIVGGTQVYIRALAQASPRAVIKTSADISAITHSGNQYSVREANGQVSDFDHLIVATSPWDALRLLNDVDGMERRRQELSRFGSFKTVIAVHSDRRWMPAEKKYWAVSNMRYDEAYCHNTVWKKWKSPRPIFRSWVTFEKQIPDSLHALVDYQHVKINLDYYQAQQNLITQQGDQHLWLAGLYMHDIDSHESAVMSAVNIARQLDPESVNLGKLSVG
ncbi:MAG: FAD-dependent oxidoreductase [Anaerolineae bacterium]|nr:FAD-dependent oxidoreductase [Anaerolineae bacterium]